METGMSIRKPMRARKTMAPRSRKSGTVLDRMKGVHEPGRTPSGGFGRESPLADTHGSNHYSPKGENVLLSPPPMLNKPLTELAAGSAVGFRDCPRESTQDLPKSPFDTNEDMETFLRAGALQDLLYQWYEKSDKNGEKPVEVHLNLVPVPCLSEAQRTSPATAANPNKDKAPRKRRKLESDEGALGNRLQASDRVGEDNSSSRKHRQLINLENTKFFIQDHLVAAVGGLERHLQEINQRLEQTQCRQKHEGIPNKLIKRTSKLEKRVTALCAIQAEQFKKMKLPGSDASNKILNRCTSLPGHTKQQPAPLTKSNLPRGAESLPSSTPLPQVTESSEDLESHHPGVPTAKVSDVHQTAIPAVVGASAQTPDSKKGKLLIDLTEEGSSAGAALDKEAQTSAPGKANSSPESQKADPPQPVLAPPKEVPRERVHLPPLPKPRLLPAGVEDFKGTVSPQKLQLTVVRLLKPKGVALQLDITEVDARCALLESFHLFFFVDSPAAGTPFSWTQTKVIEALPLPMFVSLGELPASGTYYFTVQSKDVYGRHGPFSDIQTVSVT